MCQHKKGRLLVGNGYLGLLLFAGICWIIAMSAGELQTMARAWNELLESSGLDVVPDGTRQSGSKHAVSETVITRRREEGFQALEVWITFDGHFTKDLAEREVSAWRRFYALRQLQCDNNVALNAGCACSHHMSCHPCIGVWGSWILTRTQCAHLRAVQDRMLGKDVFCTKTP